MTGGICYVFHKKSPLYSLLAGFYQIWFLNNPVPILLNSETMSYLKNGEKKILNFLPNKLNFCCVNYSRAETIWGNTIHIFSLYNQSIKPKQASNQEILIRQDCNTCDFYGTCLTSQVYSLWFVNSTSWMTWKSRNHFGLFDLWTIFWYRKDELFNKTSIVPWSGPNHHFFVLDNSTFCQKLLCSVDK